MFCFKLEVLDAHRAEKTIRKTIGRSAHVVSYRSSAELGLMLDSRGAGARADASVESDLKRRCLKGTDVFLVFRTHMPTVMYSTVIDLLTPSSTSEIWQRVWTRLFTPSDVFSHTSNEILSALVKPRDLGLTVGEFLPYLTVVSHLWIQTSERFERKSKSCPACRSDVGVGMCTAMDGSDVKYYKGEDTLLDCELKCAWRSNLCVNLVRISIVFLSR